MKNPSTLLDNMLSSLQAIDFNPDNPVINYIRSIETVARSVKELEDGVAEHIFSSPEEEIDFFRNWKPQFDGRLIYYLRLANLESRMPDAAPDKLRFLRRELRRLKSYYRLNYDFCRYMATGASYLDHLYFLRAEQADPAFIYDFNYAYDPRVNTRLSYKAAKLHAYKMLSYFIKDAMLDLTGTGHKNDDGGGLNWQAPKVYLAELIYGLYAMGVFGNVELQRIVKVMATSFNAHFANSYKVFEEIRLRKKNRTTFIDAMRLNLLRRMEQDDEFAL